MEFILSINCLRGRSGGWPSDHSRSTHCPPQGWRSDLVGPGLGSITINLFPQLTSMKVSFHVIGYVFGSVPQN